MSDPSPIPKRPAWRTKLRTALIGGAVVLIVIVWNNRQNAIEIAEAIHGVAWREVVSRDGTFSATFPATPTSRQEQVQSMGRTVTVHTLTCGTPHYRCSVAYFQIPPDVRSANTPDQLFAASANSIGQGDGGARLVSERVISLGSYPGRERRIDNRSDTSAAETLMRLYLIGDRIYWLQFIAKPNSPTFETDAPTFLESFRPEGP